MRNKNKQCNALWDFEALSLKTNGAKTEIFSGNSSSFRSKALNATEDVGH